MNYLRWIWHNTTGIRPNMLVRIVAGIGRVALGLLMVWLCKRFIDVTIVEGSQRDIVLMIAALVAVIVGGIICRQLYYYLGIKAGARQSTAIRLRIFSHLFRRQMFDQKELHSGDVTNRLEKDIDKVSDATTSLIPDMAVTMVQLVGAFLLMQSMDARLAWALLLLTPLFLFVGKLFARQMRKMTLDIRQQESVIQMLVQETMEHNAVLRSLESGDWLRADWTTCSRSCEARYGGGRASPSSRGCSSRRASAWATSSPSSGGPCSCAGARSPSA